MQLSTEERQKVDQAQEILIQLDGSDNQTHPAWIMLLEASTRNLVSIITRAAEAPPAAELLGPLLSANWVVRASMTGGVVYVSFERDTDLIDSHGADLYEAVMAGVVAIEQLDLD